MWFQVRLHRYQYIWPHSRTTSVMFWPKYNIWPSLLSYSSALKNMTHDHDTNAKAKMQDFFVSGRSALMQTKYDASE